VIRYFNRVTGREEHETVLGDRWIKLAYGTKVGLWLVRCLLVRRWVSRVMGSLQDSRWSRHRIPQFVRELQIRTEDFEPGPYPSFNSYFIRRFRKGVRTFESHPGLMPAFAEARYFGFAAREDGADPDADIRYPVKGRYLTADGLLGPGSTERPHSLRKVFEGGPVLIARLCPADYHRFHFPDRGKCIETNCK
jgi:phosphatidylserine decarboxylase